MKNLLAVAFPLLSLLQVTLAQTPGDSTDYFQESEYPTFQENYNAHAAFVDGNRWTTSTGTRSLDRKWKNVADEFEVSPEGQAAFQQALKQRGMLPFYSFGGLGLMLGALPLMATASQFDWQVGLGLGMVVGGFALIFVGGKKARQSADNLDRAIWLRNRDEMLRYASPTSQSRLRYLYESETIYLTTNSYVKNGRDYKLGFLGGKGAREFQNSPASLNLYKKYRNNQNLGAVVNLAGLAAVLIAPNASGSRGGNGLFYGGIIGMSVGSVISFSGQRFLREAVHIRNYTVLNQKMSGE